VTHRIEVDPIACDGHGMCAELLPELIELDDWGYPVIAAVDIPRRLRPLARRAVRVCPTLALRLRQAERSRPVEALPPPRSVRQRGSRERRDDTDDAGDQQRFDDAASEDQQRDQRGSQHRELPGGL
jgi:ferredoxin